MGRFFDLDTVLSVATLEEIVENDIIYDFLDHIFKRTIESYEYDESMLQARSYLWEIYPVLKTLTKKDVYCENCKTLIKNEIGKKVLVYPIRRQYRNLKEKKGYIKTIKD